MLLVIGIWILLVTLMMSLQLGLVALLCKYFVRNVEVNKFMYDMILFCLIHMYHNWINLLLDV